MFTVFFSAMDYAASEDTKYEYKLEGFNDQWLSTHENKITYTNLAPGRYLLKARMLNATDDASVAELAIVIEPPFWRSNWAYLIYGALLLAAIGLAWWLIRYSEKQKFAMMQIEKEKQREHEVDEMRLRFFTNISHELRTPLSLMIAPLENVIKSIDDSDTKNKLEMALRNAMRLLDMVNQLLDLRKSEVKGHQLNLMQGDIVDHIHSVCNSFGEHYEKKNIKPVFFSAVKELWTEFDADKITKIVMNLLSNVFKFTPDGGKVDVSLDVLDTDDGRQKFEIKVTDTGIGISDEDKKHIFERFYQAKNPSKTGGSGIGLHLTKEFVDLHGGKIDVCDNLGKGTAFIITLPISTHEMDAKTTGGIKPDTDKPIVLIVDDKIIASWAPSICSRVEDDGQTHFYLYFSNSGFGTGVLTATSPVGPWSSPLDRSIVDAQTPGLGDCSVPFDPGVVIDDEGTGWLSFGAGKARLARLGKDMLSFDSPFTVLPAKRHFEANELNIIGGRMVYIYNLDWNEEPRCTMGYMLPEGDVLDTDSWKYQDIFILNPGDDGFEYSNNHTHLHKYEGRWYVFGHTLALKNAKHIKGGYRSICVENIDVDEANQQISMAHYTRQGVEQIRLINPFEQQEMETVFATLGVNFEPADEPGNMTASADSTGVTMVRGVEFDKTPRSIDFICDGVGQIDVRLDNPDGELIASTIVDGNTSAKLLSKPQGTHDVVFVFQGKDLKIDKWVMK